MGQSSDEYWDEEAERHGKKRKKKAATQNSKNRKVVEVETSDDEEEESAAVRNNITALLKEQSKRKRSMVQIDSDQDASPMIGNKNSGQSGASTSKGSTHPFLKVALPPRKKQRSQVWRYFTKKNGIASCLHCTGIENKIMQSGTGNLITHLSNVHDIVIEKTTPGPPRRPLSRADEKLTQSTLNFKKEKKLNSLEDIYTDLVCRDGISVNCVSKSRYIKQSLEKRGLPANSKPQTIMEKVKGNVKKVVVELKNKLVSEIEDGVRYSITFDEWTSSRGRKYLNINLHRADKSKEHLGMVRVKGAQTTESIIELVKKRLEKFGLDINLVVSCITDGASIMVKFGQIVNAIHQICLAHAIHLCVTDVLYEKKKKSRKSTEGEEVEDEEEEREESEAELSGADSDFGESDDDQREEERMILDPNYTETCHAWTVPAMHGRRSSALTEKIKDLKPEYDAIFTKVRNICKIFRSSSNLDYILQAKVKEKLGHELRLKLDCRTRWDSALKMLITYLRVHDIVTTILKRDSKYTLYTNKKT